MSSATPSAPVASGTIKQISGLPLLGNALEFQKDRLALLCRVARECGEIGGFRLGPVPVVMPNSAELIEQLLIDKGDEIHRGRFFDAFIPVLGTHSILTRDGEYHRQQRKLHMPAFAPRRLPRYAEAMVRCTRQVLDGLQDGQEVDMEHVMGRVARLIAAATLFSIDEGPLVSHFQKAISVVEAYVAHAMSSLVQIPLSWPTPANQRARAAISELRRRAEEIVAEYRKHGEDKGDLLSMLLQARDENGEALSDEQLRDHAVTIYIAGQETTAVALTWMAILLAWHPEIQARARQQVDEVLQGREPTAEDLPRLSYLLQIVKETLRLYPPAAAIGRETLEEVELGGYRLPAKQFIMISPYTLHRVARYYPEPERFIPERFRPEEEKQRPRNAFLPFATGVHTCMGNHFALMEMQLSLASMLQKIHFELVPGQDIRPKLLITVKASSARFIIRHRTDVS
ncbi:cytochrome P450 [Vitiosangium sp. GDMCC 1.1324]|uniref:cytochrome P450 n=1 Tax=Vitiosangium sp. (strain GDMCC 1.1324) TaxID=2138576 RepID=UPI00130DAD5F|nr:cytochrome P450 [Vitiosangium sp. GDMCC 1.1324]